MFEIPKKPIQFGIHVSRPHKKWAVLALIAVTIGSALDTFTVIIFKNLTDSIVSHPLVIHTVWIWALSYPLIVFVSENVWRVSGFTGMRWFMNTRSVAYKTLYEYLSLHSKDYFNNRFAGTLTNKISNAVEGTDDLFEQFLWRFYPLILGVGWYIVYAWMSDYRLGLIIAVWSLVFVVINAYSAKLLQPSSFKFAESLSDLKGSIVDSVSNISLVHEYANVTGERKYVGKFIDKQFEAGIKRWRLSEWILFANGVLVFIFLMLMIGTSVFLLSKNLVGIGVIVMVIFIVNDLSKQLFFFGKEARDAARYYGEAREGLEEILKEHIIVDVPNATELHVKNGAIEIDAVTFEYSETGVFRNFSLSIPPGQKVGLVGKSGAGKSTFVSLLLRHFDLQKGSILIDGQNIAEVTLESLRRAIAFVPQDTSLFHRSIFENIKYGSSGRSEKEVYDAAKKAQAHDFIKNLPQGYETLVGERGVKLSGGQRQRIAIARAFLKNAPILILDEATSSLDSESEQAIQKSLEELMKDRTVIAIAHRLSTLKEMDRIVIIEKGKIAEDGNPNELLKEKDGVFKNMWDHQVKGFIRDSE